MTTKAEIDSKIHSIETWIIQCDIEATHVLASDDEGCGSRFEFAQRATEDGWHVIDGKVHCPECFMFGSSPK